MRLLLATWALGTLLLLGVVGYMLHEKASKPELPETYKLQIQQDQQGG